MLKIISEADAERVRQKKELDQVGHVDRSITLTNNLNNKRLNQKNCRVSYCLQLTCGEILTVIYCSVECLWISTFLEQSLS